MVGAPIIFRDGRRAPARSCRVAGSRAGGGSSCVRRQDPPGPRPTCTIGRAWGSGPRLALRHPARGGHENTGKGGGFVLQLLTSRPAASPAGPPLRPRASSLRLLPRQEALRAPRRRRAGSPQGGPAPRAAPRGRQPQAPWCPARRSDEASRAQCTEPLVAREPVSSKRARSRGFPTAEGRGRSCRRAGPRRRGCVSGSDRCAPGAPPPEGAQAAPRRPSRAGAPFAPGSLSPALVDEALRSFPACNAGGGPSTPPQSRGRDSPRRVPRTAPWPLRSRGSYCYRQS